MRKILLILSCVFTSAMYAQNWTWTTQTSPITTTLNDVFFIDNSNGWAVGNNGVIIHTTNGGQLWTVQQSGVTGNLSAVFFVDANNGYAVGGSTGLTKPAIKTTDGGTTWTNMTVGNPSFPYVDVAFSSVNHGLIVSWDSIYATSDAGATWVKEGYVAGVTGTSDNRAVSCFNDSVAVVGGGRHKPSSTSIKQGEIFDRRLWNSPNIWGTSAASQIDESDRIKCIDVAGPTRAFAGGINGKVYRMETTGINYNGPWTVVLDLAPVSNQWIWAMSFPTELLGMIMTDVVIGTSNPMVIYHTSNAGASWSAAPDTINAFLNSLHAPTPVDAWAVGAGGAIYKGAPNNIGLEENELVNVKVYPNPASDFVTIEVPSDHNAAMNYAIFNVLGSVVANGTFETSGKYDLNIESLTTGVYYIQLDNGTTVVKTIKLLKK